MKHIKLFEQFINEAVKVNIPMDEWEITPIDGDMGTKLVAAEWKGKYYSAYATFGPGDEIVELDDLQQVSKKEYEGYFR